MARRNAIAGAIFSAPFSIACYAGIAAALSQNWTLTAICGAVMGSTACLAGWSVVRESRGQQSPVAQSVHWCAACRQVRPASEFGRGISGQVWACSSCLAPE